MPAIFLLFTSDLATAGPAAETTLAAGLLVVSLLGTLAGALGLSAIAAERKPTANLAAGVMALSVSVTVGIVGMFGGFEVLAAHMVPTASGLFQMLVGVAGIVGVLLTSAAIADCYQLGPVDDPDLWIGRRWITSQRKGTQRFLISASVGIALVGVALVLRVAVGLHVALSLGTVYATIGTSVFLVLAGLVYGLVRTAHRDDGRQRGLHPLEGYGTVAASIAGVVLVLFVLP